MTKDAITSPDAPAALGPLLYRIVYQPISEASAGSLCCVDCGYAISLAAIASVPECPNCGGRSFRRTSPVNGSKTARF